MSDFFMPPGRRSGALERLSRFSMPVGTPSGVAESQVGDDGGFKLGLGTLFSEIGQGLTSLASIATPAKDGPGLMAMGEGIASSMAGTGLTALTPLTGFVEALPGEVDLEAPIARRIGEFLGDDEEEEAALTPMNFADRVADRGLLPALVEEVGNVALVGAAVTAPVKGAAVGARAAGATETAARLTAVHEGLISRPLIKAMQHPYRTAGGAARSRLLTPALDKKLAVSGVSNVPERLAPIDYLAAELPDTGVDYGKVQVDMEEHAARAEAYKNLPDNDPDAAAAYDAFAAETAEQYRHATEDLGLTFEFVDEAEPYAAYEDMLADVRDNKRLRVAKTTEDAHPRLTPEQNDQFRAVHDLYGHAATGRDFARHGEEAAFLAHRSMYGDEAGRAMASETRGQNAVLINDGEFPAQKAALLPDGLDDPAGAIARFQKEAPAPIGRTTKVLAGIEERLVGFSANRAAREQTRLADMERSIAARSPGIRQAVKVARDHILEEAKAADIPLTRKEASLMVGDEIRSRMNGVKAVEEEFLSRGLTEADIVRAGVRQRHIPAALRTPEMEAQLVAAVDANLTEHTKIREILTSTRKGDEGLDPEDAVDATPTKRDRDALALAKKKLARAESDVLARKAARERASREGFIAAQKDRLGRTAAHAARAAQEQADALAEFEHSRDWTPRAWRGAGALEASAETIHAQTLADLESHGGEWGGASFDPHTGSFVKGGQGKGYSVGLVPDTALTVPLEEFTPQHIEQVVRAYQDVYQHPGTLVGTWVEDGQVYIDPSEIVPTLDDALIRGGARGQLSIYDVAGDDVVTGILRDRPDIAEPFIGRHRNLSARAKELRRIAERADLTPDDVNMHLDMLMRQAVRAHELGLVTHPDEFFRKYVSKFEFAKRRSTKAGTLGQIVLERSVDKTLWKDAVATIKDIDKVRGWYHESHRLVESLFRDQPDVTLLDGTKINPADLMYQIVAITSFQAMPRDNWTRAMAVFQKYDTLPKAETKALTAAMKKVTSGKATLEEAFGVVKEAGLADQFAGVGLYGTPKQYLAELFSGQTIDKWTPEHFEAAKGGFGVGSTPDRAKALDFVQEHYPELVDRIGEDAAVKEFWGRQHRAKIITFWDNLADPENSLGVTMDQQMERLFGEEMSISQTAAGNDSWIRYSEQIRDLAEELSETLGEKVLPHELQAVMWVFAKDEVLRIQQGHFNALANDAVDMVKAGEQIADDADPILQWIEEASEPYVAEGQRHVRKHRIVRAETEPPAGPALPVSHTAAPHPYTASDNALRIQVTAKGAGKGINHFYDAADDVVGYIDYTPDLQRPGEVYIHFMSTRPDYGGQGIQRQLVDELYKVTGDSKINFGEIQAGQVEVLRRKMKEAHPDRGNYGKPGRWEADEADAHFKAQPKRVAGGVESVEDVVYRPGWGAKNREGKIGLFTKRKVKWLATRAEINADLAIGDTAAATRKMNKFVTDMQTKAPRSLGLADDAAGADFMDIWMKGEFHSAGYKAAADALDRLDVAPGELPPLMQKFKDTVLGEFVPLDDGTRGVIRIFEDGNLATLVHENGHLLRRMLPEGEMRAVENAYGVKNRVWDVAAEERFANDFLQYMTDGSAPKGLATTFARVKEVLRDIWDMVSGTFHNRRVHPELHAVFDSWLDPAVTEGPPAPGIPGLPERLPETGTVKQRSARPPRLPEPPAKKGDYYAAGRQGAKALAKVEKLAVRQRELAKSAAQIQRTIDQVRVVLDEGRLPSELEADTLRAEAAQIQERVNERMNRPSVSRTPARWQPMWQATKTLAKEAETNPGLAAQLADLPQTLHDIQQLAIAKGFEPAHVRDFTPQQVKRLVFGSMKLGKGGDLSHEYAAGTRKARTGTLAKAGAVDRSVEALLAATVEATMEKRTNAVVDWVEGTVARRLPEGTEIPDGWALWDPARTHLLTGEVISDATRKATQTATKDSLIVPEGVIRTLDRFTKDYDHWAWQAISKVTSPWRTLVLTLSPGWYVRNVVGNAIMATAEGASLKDWRKAWTSYKKKDEIGRFADLPFVTSDTLAQEAGVFADDSLIPRKGPREAMAEGGRVRGGAQYASRKMLRVNEVVDEFARSAVYHRGVRKGMTNEQAWHRAKEALVDYNALSPFERSAVRSVIPFYAWQKGILKVTLDQIIDHPARVAILALIGQVQDEYIADRFGVDTEDVPGYYKHLVGNTNLRSFNPFSDPSEIVTVEGITRSMNPFIELGIRKGLGAPEFYSDQQRLGFFGTPQQDVNVPGSLEEMVTRSPGGRILGDGPGLGTVGFTTVDEDALRSRFLRARRSIRGIANPETGSGQDAFLPPRAA